MSKYIDAGKLIAEIKRYKNKADERLKIKGRTFGEEQKDLALQNLCGNLLHFIASLQQKQPKLLTAKDAWGNMRLEAYAQASGANCVDEHSKMFSLCDIDEIFENIGDVEQPNFPTTDEQIKEFLATHPKIEVPEKYKNPDWLFKKLEQSEGLHFTPLNRLIQKIPSERWNDTVNNYARKLRDCLIREGYRKDAELLQGYISYMNGHNVPIEQEYPKVDLEKEIDSEWKKCEPIDEGMGLESANIVNEQFDHIARHFYELGRTRK